MVADLPTWADGNFCGNWVRKFRTRGLQPVKPGQNPSTAPAETGILRNSARFSHRQSLLKNRVRKFRTRGLQPVKPKQKTSSSSNNRRPAEAEKPQIRQGSSKTRSTPTNRWKRYPLRPSRCGAAESPCAPPPQRRGGGAFLPRRVPSCAPGAWPDRPWSDRPFSWGPFP